MKTSPDTNVFINLTEHSTVIVYWRQMQRHHSQLTYFHTSGHSF